MSESATIAKTDGKPKRPLTEIHRDLDAARAKHKELHPRVELDTRRGNALNEQTARRLEAWKKAHPDDVFDEILAGFSAEPYKFDEKLQAAFHAVHYDIARLETEQAAAIGDRAKA